MQDVLEIEGRGELECRLGHEGHAPGVGVELAVELGVRQRLTGELGETHDEILLGELVGLAAVELEEADRLAVREQRHVERPAVAPAQRLAALVLGGLRLFKDVAGDHGAALGQRLDEGPVVGQLPALPDGVLVPVAADGDEDLDLVAVEPVDVAQVRSGHLDQALGHGGEHGVVIEAGAEVQRRVDQQAQFAVALLQAVEQRRLLERRGEQAADATDEIEPVGEVADPRVEDVDEADRPSRRRPAASRPCCDSPSGGRGRAPSRGGRPGRGRRARSDRSRPGRRRSPGSRRARRCGRPHRRPSPGCRCWPGTSCARRRRGRCRSSRRSAPRAAAWRRCGRGSAARRPHPARRRARRARAAPRCSPAAPRAGRRW